MADTLRPASLLVGAAGLWAVCVLLLALAGLGSRVPDPVVAPVPPAIPAVVATPNRSRLGPLLDYAQVGQRPLLNVDRRPGPQPAAATGASDELDVVLTSVLITPSLQLAILTDTKDQSSRRVRVGENVTGSNWRLASVGPRSAVLDGPSGQRTLELRVYDGQGGVTPTALGVAGKAPGNDGGASGPGGQPLTPEQAARVPAGRDLSRAVPPLATASAPPPAPTPTPTMQPQPTTQDAQIEAIRRRIEARRAQMRAEAEAAGTQNR